jgi:hypothetical protein
MQKNHAKIKMGILMFTDYPSIAVPYGRLKSLPVLHGQIKVPKMPAQPAQRRRQRHGHPVSLIC